MSESKSQRVIRLEGRAPKPLTQRTQTRFTGADKSVFFLAGFGLEGKGGSLSVA